MSVGLYARVSTKVKEQNPEKQLIMLTEYRKAKGWEYREFVDYTSGTKMDRPYLKSIMNDLAKMDEILVLIREMISERAKDGMVRIRNVK